jgi:hypothetical protein
MKDTPQDDPNYAILDTHVNQLAEHFDNIQILVSSVTEQGDATTSYSRGAGNWAARVHHARLFVLRDDETERHAIRKFLDEE